MENSTKNQMKVGVFVLIGTLLAMGSIIILGGNGTLFTKNVMIHSQFDSVQGLNIGSVVSVTGINIGNVESISFRKNDNTIDVTMKVQEKFLKNIPQGSTAEIRTQGALGDKFIYITPAEPNSPPIEAGAVLPMSHSSDLMAMISEQGAQAGKIFDIISEVHKTIKAINDGNRAERIMSNLAEASQNLKQVSYESQKMVSEISSNKSSEKMRDSIERLNHIITKVDRGEGTLGALINDPTIHEQIKNVLGGSSRKKFMQNVIRSSIEKGEDASK